MRNKDLSRHRRCSQPLCTQKSLRVFVLTLFWLSITTCTQIVWGRSFWRIPKSKSFWNPLCGTNERVVINADAREDENDERVKKSCRRRQTYLFSGGNTGNSVAAEQVSVRRGHHDNEINQCSLVSIKKGSNNLCTGEDCSVYSIENVNRNIPTPWPINVIKERWNRRHDSSYSDKTLSSNSSDRRPNPTSSYPSMGVLFFAYTKQQARIRIRQMSEVASQVWYNLPPSAPPLILLASIPRKVKVAEGRTLVDATSNDGFRRIIPLFSDPFARSLALAGLGVAVLSWSNQELQRKRKLSPLALPAMNTLHGEGGKVRVSKVFLPPFLPEDVHEPEIDALLTNAFGDKMAADRFTSEIVDNEENILSRVSPKIRKHLSGIYETTTTTPRRFLKGYYSDWLQGRATRKREVAKIRRKRVYDELVALQALKKRQSASKIEAKNETESSEMGFALITGASRGIGRAIAVELARWEIPLVLVARDVDKLTRLASDLEACYGVKCCVLGADLTQVNSAERIKQATDDAGISVDILINNAGVASEGLAVDAKTSNIERMVILNSLTYAKLSALYGKEMKKRRRGRILMMSSMAGLCNGAPNTAIYGACKAFGKSLALSMAREMETYGVGVTCLMPGAVFDTDFRNNSGTRKALVWYLPFYPKSPDSVAHQGVISLLDGDTRSIPGWQNRAFANIVRPIIPQRVEIMMVQLAFSPLRIPSIKNLWRRDDSEREKSSVIDSSSPHSSSPTESSPWLSLKPRYSIQPPPRFLKLPEEESTEMHTHHKELNDVDLEQEEPSSLARMRGNEANSTNEEMHTKNIEVADEEVIYQSDATSKPPNQHDPTKRNETTYKDESHSIERYPELSENHEKGRHENSNIRENDQNSEIKEQARSPRGEKRNTVFIDRTASPKRQHIQESPRAEIPSTAQKRREEKTTEGIGIESVQRSHTPQWFDYQCDDDDTFSTRLGPISMKESGELMLSKQCSKNQQGTSIIFV